MHTYGYNFLNKISFYLSVYVIVYVSALCFKNYVLLTTTLPIFAGGGSYDMTCKTQRIG